MSYSKEISSSAITAEQYVSEGAELSLSNRGQMELLLAMLESGNALRTTARGFSMHPFIRDKDVLTISPVKETKLSLGDVVAFTQPTNGRLAIHRIIGLTEDGWLIKGDNCLEPDGVVPNEKILGRVCRIERGGKEARLGISKASLLIVILNRSNVLSHLKKSLILPLRAAGDTLQKIQSLAVYRWFVKRLSFQAVISVADEDDMEAVHRMFNPEVPYLRQNPDPNVTNWVAKRNGNIIGFTQNVYHSKEHHPWVGHWIFSLHVRIRYRCAGIGEKLTMCALEKAKEQNAEKIFLVVFEDNKKAVSLYSKLGFNHIILSDLEPMLAEEKLRTGRRRIVMSKKLRQAND